MSRITVALQVIVGNEHGLTYFDDEGLEMYSDGDFLWIARFGVQIAAFHVDRVVTAIRDENTTPNHL